MRFRPRTPVRCPAVTESLVSCPNRNEPSGNCNESQQWRLIGTVVIQCPGGVCPTPEPGSLALMSTILPGFAGITWIRPRRKIDRIVHRTPDRTAPPITT